MIITAVSSLDIELPEERLGFPLAGQSLLVQRTTSTHRLSSSAGKTHLTSVPQTLRSSKSLCHTYLHRLVSSRLQGGFQCELPGEAELHMRQIHVGHSSPQPHISFHFSCLYLSLSIMAEALGIAGSVVAVLQVTQSVLSVIYDYNAALKGASWEVPRVKDEIEGLRNVLQSLEPLMREAEFADPAAGTRLPTLVKLCGPKGVLQSCEEELQRLETKLKPSGWSKNLGPRRKAFIESLRWPFKEAETNKILHRIGRFKDVLALAISADNT